MNNNAHTYNRLAYGGSEPINNTGLRIMITRYRKLFKFLIRVFHCIPFGRLVFFGRVFVDVRRSLRLFRSRRRRRRRVRRRIAAGQYFSVRLTTDLFDRLGPPRRRSGGLSAPRRRRIALEFSGLPSDLRPRRWSGGRGLIERHETLLSIT